MSHAREAQGGSPPSLPEQQRVARVATPPSTRPLSSQPLTQALNQTVALAVDAQSPSLPPRRSGVPVLPAIPQRDCGEHPVRAGRGEPRVRRAAVTGCQHNGFTFPFDSNHHLRSPPEDAKECVKRAVGAIYLVDPNRCRVIARNRQYEPFRDSNLADNGRMRDVQQQNDLLGSDHRSGPSASADASARTNAIGVGVVGWQGQQTRYGQFRNDPVGDDPSITSQ